MKEISEELQKRVKAINNSCYRRINHSGHKVTYNGRTNIIKGLNFTIKFLGHSKNDNITHIAEKLLKIMKSKSNIKSWKYNNANWLIEDDKFYITNLFLECKYDEQEYKVIDIYPELFNEEKTLAYWYSDNISFGNGELWVYSAHSHSQNIYAKEIKFEIKNGIVISKKDIDNTKLYKRKVYVEE